VTPSLVGTTIGSIRIETLLATGGMGEVYRGFDTKLERRVAVKTIRAAGRMDGELRARFLREARILSKLEHPAICQVYDLVERPEADYLIFELVEGETLRMRLGRGALVESDALGIAEKIAMGLAAAHGERIVHRDLKPENVMLTPGGAVKILDFGISRAVRDPTGPPDRTPERPSPGVRGSDPDSTTLRLARADPDSPTLDADLTQLGSLVGTIRYMSPEQAEGRDLAEASDLYSLGIVLQEMLTGRPAYPEGGRAFDLIAQVARGESLPYHSEDPDLERLVGDLKRRTPEHRPTADEAAGRLRHVLARPERLRRQRLRWYAAVVAFATLLAVLSVVSVLAVRAGRNAERAAHEAARANEEARRANEEALRANRESETARQVASFLIDLFEQASPDNQSGGEVTAREIVDLGVQRVGLELRSQPVVQASLQDTLGSIYRRMGHYEEAERLLQQALETRQGAASEPLALARTRAHLGELYADLGRWPEAENLLAAAGGVYESLAPRSAEHAQILNDRATVAFEAGRFEDARELYVAALAIQDAAGAAGSLEQASTLNNLAILVWQLGDYPEAQRLLERSFEIKSEQLAPDHPELAVLANNLGILLREQGRYGEAEERHRNALAVAERALGPDHPEVASVLLSLGRLLVVTGRLAEAEPRLERARRILETGLGADHPELARCLLLLGDLRRRQLRFGEARSALDRAGAVLEPAVGADHPLTIEWLHVRANLARDQRRHAEARNLYAQAIERALRGLGEGHPDLRALRADAERL
jgi:serine/threonine-protein kinase